VVVADRSSFEDIDQDWDSASLLSHLTSSATFPGVAFAERKEQEREIEGLGGGVELNTVRTTAVYGAAWSNRWKERRKTVVVVSST
jgi:hypothetical protein